MKIKNNLTYLIAIFISIIGLLIYSIIRQFDTIYLALPFFVLVSIFLRILKVLKKNLLEYLNGPKRFCKGKGVEIGSGGHHMVKGSILVDIVNNFSNPNSYKVDYIADAHCLPKIESNSLDYVCASNVLEHLTNPIKAILEWLRILKIGGVIWLKIPDKRKTFDKTRERTKLGHLIEDFENNVPIDDPTHIDDHNQNSNPSRNESHPYIHNHVWMIDDSIELFDYINREHTALNIIKYSENTCKNAQDFWIVVRKSSEKGGHVRKGHTSIDVFPSDTFPKPLERCWGS